MTTTATVFDNETNMESVGPPRPGPDGELLPNDEHRFVTGVGQRLCNVHPMTADCEKFGCVIHAPSDHHMRDFPTCWRPDRGIMERICPHGVGHPDPDDQNYITRTRGEGHMEGVHGCDGCCADVTEPLRKELDIVTREMRPLSRMDARTDLAAEGL